MDVYAGIKRAPPRRGRVSHPLSSPGPGDAVGDHGDKFQEFVGFPLALDTGVAENTFCRVSKSPRSHATSMA